MTQTTQRQPPATRGPLSQPPHSSTSRHHVTLMPLVSPLCPRPSTLAASSCWPQCLLSVIVLTPRCCLRVLTVSPHVLIVCSSGLSGPRYFLLQLSGSLPRPTSGRNVTSGRRPTLLAARLALHTTLVKQPLASPSWSIVPVAARARTNKNNTEKSRSRPLISHHLRARSQSTIRTRLSDKTTTTCI